MDLDVCPCRMANDRESHFFVRLFDGFGEDFFWFHARDENSDFVDMGKEGTPKESVPSFRLRRS